MPEDNNELLKRLQEQVNTMEQNQQGGGDVGKILDENVTSAEQREELAKRLIASAGSEAIIAKLTEAIKHPWYNRYGPQSPNSLVEPIPAWQRPGPYEFGSGHGNRSGTGATGETSDYVTPKGGYGQGGGSGSSEGGGGGYTGGGGPGDSTQQQQQPAPDVSITRGRTPYHDTRSWPDSAGRGRTPYHSTHPGIDPGQYKVPQTDTGAPPDQVSVDRARTPFHDTHPALDSGGRGRTPYHSTHPGIAPGQYKVDVPGSGGGTVSRPPAEGAQGPYGGGAPAQGAQGPYGGSQPSAPVRTGGTPAITKFGVGVGGYTQEQLKGRPMQEQHAIHFEGFEGIDTKSQFDYGTGHKVTGKWGAPYGTYSLNPQPLSSATTISDFYGKSTPHTGAFDTVYNVGRGKGDPTHTGFDPAAGRGRGGIQIHAQPGRINELWSAGCLAIPEKQFPAFREAFDKAWKQTGGKVAIEVGPKGATIRPIQGSGGQTMSADQAIQNQKSTGSVTGNPYTAPQKVDPHSATIRTKLTGPEGEMFGSGFHIGGGYFLTDSHNIKTNTKSVDVLYGKNSARAEVVHNAPNTDYALLKISSADQQKLEQHGMSSLPVSKTDPAIGSHLQVSGTPGATGKYKSFGGQYGGLTQRDVVLEGGGTITSPRNVGREYTVRPDSPNDQSITGNERITGGPAVAGMSGGPVTNEKGEAIGVFTGISGQGGRSEFASMPARRMFESMPEGIRKQVETATLQADMARNQGRMMEDLNKRSGGTAGGATSGRGGGFGGRKTFEQPQGGDSGGGGSGGDSSGGQYGGGGGQYPLTRYPKSQPIHSTPGRAKGEQLSTWAKNPGAMWPGPSASRFGSTQHFMIPDRQHNQIAIFPSHELGAAAQFDLWARKYSGMTVGDAIQKWSGHNSSAAYAKSLGVPMDRKISREWLASPEGLHFMIKQSKWEAGAHYPLSEEGFARAQKLAFGHGGSTESGKGGTQTGGETGRSGGGKPDVSGRTFTEPRYTGSSGHALPANQAANLGLSPKDKMVWISSPSGARFQVNEKVAGQFKGFLTDLEKTGYRVSSSGGYNYRQMRGSQRLSQHAYGSAIDIDAAHNPLGSTHTNMPAGTSELAKKWGLSWGHEWQGRKDPMHFEVSRMVQHSNSQDRSPESTPKEAPSHGAEEPHHYFSHTGKHEEGGAPTQQVQPQTFSNYYRWNRRIQQSAMDHKANQFNAAQSTPHHKQPAPPPHDTNDKHSTHTQKEQPTHTPDAAKNTNKGHDWTKFHHPPAAATSRVEHTFAKSKSSDEKFSTAGQVNN